MITLTRLNHRELVVNAAHIVTVEATPDTIVTLIGGERLIVRESPDAVTSLVVEYLRRVGWVTMMLSPVIEGGR
ncbi:MAG: flagellar FlbD family protein [Deltaproteobacteria bacterium]|nr:flagellar FlbD family protein [Deltaproteobacteria bacterium]